MADPHVPQFPEPLVEFVQRFNDEEFWESHEVLEDAWRQSRSEFYHGMILYASAFVHVQRRNAHGVIAQLKKAENALAAYAPDYLGIDVAGVLRNARQVASLVSAAAVPDDWLGRISFPRLRLDPTRIGGSEREMKPR